MKAELDPKLRIVSLTVRGIDEAVNTPKMALGLDELQGWERYLHPGEKTWEIIFHVESGEKYRTVSKGAKEPVIEHIQRLFSHYPESCTRIS